MAKREKNPASDKTGNDTGVSLLVLGIVSVIFALWIPIVGDRSGDCIACKSAEKK